MRKFLVRSLAVVGALGLLAVVGVGILVGFAVSKKPKVPAQVILETELNRGLAEKKEQGFFEAFGREKPTVRDVVDALDRASTDDRVKVVVSDLSELTAGMAQVQELRDAVIAFRKHGKRTIAFADTFGELSPSNAAYYLATAYDEIYVQPSGSVGLVGPAAEMPYARGLFDRLGVKPIFNKRKEFKSAPEMFTEKDISPSSREQTEALLESFFGQVVRGVAEQRHLTEAQVRGVIDRSPLLANEALVAKLVDGLSYRDEVYAKARSIAGANAKPLYLSAYLDRAGRRPELGGEKVALIFGTGNVVRSQPGDEDLQDASNMRSGELTRAFREAAEDSEVKAIVFRIDSPGGSYVASDTIRRAVQLARKSGKPVIATMGNVAASGGYFVAMDADKVVAEPGTITGSIGVFSGKFVTDELWTKLGVQWRTLQRGKNAALMSSASDFTPEQKVRIDAWLDAVYADFTQKAAEGRHLPLPRLLELAKGRVWTGEDAKQRGLVDALGGMPTAIALAREAAKLPADAKVSIQVFPRERNPVEQLAQLVSGHAGNSSEDETRLGGFHWSEPAPIRMLRTWALAFGLDGREHALTAATPEVVW